MAAIEAFTNAIVGLLVSWLVTFLVLEFSAGQSAAITAMFFGISFVRSYVLRRFFAWVS